MHEDPHTDMVANFIICYQVDIPIYLSTGGSTMVTLVGEGYDYKHQEYQEEKVLVSYFSNRQVNYCAKSDYILFC